MQPHLNYFIHITYYYIGPFAKKEKDGEESLCFRLGRKGQQGKEGKVRNEKI